MIALRDEDKMAVIPLKLYKEDIERPTWMRNRQYMHYYDYQDIKTLVDMIVKFYDTGKIANKHIHAIASDDNDEMPRD